MDKLEHIGVAPHPRRKALEAAERRDGTGIVARAAHETVDPIGIGPVALDHQRVKAFLLHQAPGDAGTRAVELVRPMGRLAE